jgi:hypothetical protein
VTQLVVKQQLEKEAVQFIRKAYNGLGKTEQEIDARVSIINAHDISIKVEDVLKSKHDVHVYVELN